MCFPLPRHGALPLLGELCTVDSELPFVRESVGGLPSLIIACSSSSMALDIDEAASLPIRPDRER